MNLILTSDELKALEEIILNSLKELKEEIRHTDNFEYKEGLKEKEKMLNKLLLKVQSLSETK